MAKDLFNKYVWLVNTIYRAKKITFKEINERWSHSDMSGGMNLPLRTFNNHLEAIQDLFDINIECDRRGGYHYYIEDVDDLEKEGVRNWLLNAFATSNLINESRKLNHRILFENIPSGQHYLTPIIEAMKDNVAINMTYKSFTKPDPHSFILQPYCVKVFKQRWYVIGKSEDHDSIRTYSLDRVSGIEQTELKFDMPKDFDPATFFDNYFGIITDTKEKPEEVELKVFDDQCKYFDVLPLHHSQKVKIQRTDFTIYTYNLVPTFDFKQEILSHGAGVQVLSPKELVDEIAEDVKYMAEYYGM